MTDRDAPDRPAGDDRLIDAVLGNVPVPAEIAGRMAVGALFDDSALDRLLVAVTVPTGLASRVRQQGLAIEPPPAAVGPVVTGGAIGRLRPTDRRRRFGHDGPGLDVFLARVLWDGAAVAAAMTLVVGMFTAGTALSRLLAPAPVRNGGREAPPAIAAARPPAAKRTAPPTLRSSAREALDGLSVPPPMAAVAGAAGQAADRPAGVGSGAGATDSVTAPRPVTVRAAPPPADPQAPAARRGRGFDMRTILLPEAIRPVPRAPGFDLAFEMTHGEAPFVDPRSPALDLDRPPLSLRCDSYDAFVAGLGTSGRMAAARSRRSGPAATRVEELLAAVSPLSAEDEAVVVERAGVRFSVGAYRSLRKHPESMLVELSVTAALPAVGPPVDALVVVDQSSGPGATLAWQWACRGIARIASLMQPADRLSVVVCGSRPRLAALRADAAALSLLADELRREAPAPVADIDAGLRLVADVSRREGPPRRIVVLAHAGSLEHCRGEGRSAFSAWQAARAGTVDRAATDDVAVEFVRIDPEESPADASAVDAGVVALDGVAVIRALVEQVWGRSNLVARGCRMEVRFDPDAIRSYRIVGHRQTAADTLAAGGAPTIDLHAGETVRVVYEVVRRPGGAASGTRDPISATLHWTSASGGDASARIGLAAARISDPAGGTSPHACELLLAMGLGEWAAGSAHAEPRRQFAAALAALAAHCRGRGDGDSTLERLVEGIEREGILRPDPSGR